MLIIVFVCYGIILAQLRIGLGKYIKNFPGATLTRLFIRTSIYFIPLPFLGFPSLQARGWGVPVSILYGTLFLLFRVPELKFNLSKEFIDILSPISQEHKIREILYPLLSGIAQEYFYRGVMLYILSEFIGLWAILIATLLFVFEHFMHPHAANAYDKRDYLFQGLLGLGLGTIFYFSESLIGVMLGHIVYNSPGALQALYRKVNIIGEYGE